MSLLGIDVGTTGCKTAAYAASGACLASAYREYPTLHPRPGWAELNSRLVLARVWECIAETAVATRQDPITALCISSMGEAMTPVSADRRILGNSILHIDPRGGEHARRMADDLGRAAVYAINPNIIGPNYSMPKLLWLRENEPELYRNTWKFLLWGDLVAFMLGGEPLTSFALANRTLLFDIRRECWSETLLQWAEIPPDLLPLPVASGTIAGTVRRDAAEKLGLSPGVKIIVGAHDQCCNALGAGIHNAGKACYGMGTVACITPAYDHLPPADAMLACGLNVEHHVLPGIYLSFIYNQSGALVRWFRDTFARTDAAQTPDGEDIYDILMAEMPAEPTRLLALPHFEMTGTPHFIADSAGVLAGLHTHTTRGEILKAIIEGAAFYFLESLNAVKALGIDTSEFIATGGGAKSSAWLQILADIYSVPFVRPRITECGTLGAAMIAGLGTGCFADAAESVAQCVQRDRVFEPNPRRSALYREHYARYQRLYPALKDLLAELEQ